MIPIVPATAPRQVAAVSGLLCAYADGLLREHGMSLDFQDFAGELARLPGDYAPPAGALLLAEATEGGALGTVALRRREEGVCEIKRLYVHPAARGTGLGRRLAVAIVAEGRRLGYRRAVLDTVGFMTGAQALYASLGFCDIPPYTANPWPGARFLGLDLAPGH